MADQVLAPGLATGGVLEAAAEARPAVHFDQQLAQLHLGQPLINKLFEDHGALRPLFRFELGDDEVSILHPDTRIAVQQGIDPLQERLQLGLALGQARRAFVGDLELLAHLGAQGGPTALGDQVRLRVGVATAGFQPDFAGPQGRAQLREHAELEVPPIDPPLAVDHVGAPLGRDEIDAGAPGQVSARALAQPPEQVYGLQERVSVDVRPERERREERRDELAEVAVPPTKEVEAAVLIGADNPGRFLDDSLKSFGGNPPVDGAPELGIADRGVEHDAGQLAEEADHLVGGLGHGAAKLIEVMTGPRLGLRQAAVELVDRLVGNIDQRLVEEGRQEGIPPLLRHPLEGLAGGPAGDLGQALEPIGAQAVERPSRDTRTFQEFELLDVVQDGFRRVGDGRTTEPGERGPCPGGIGAEQAVEQGFAFAGQQGRQEAERLVLSPLPGGDHETFETGQARPHDLVGAELLAGELKQQGRPIVLQGPLDEPGLEGPQVTGSGPAKAEVGQDFLEVTGPGLRPLPVPGEALGSDAELAGEMADGGRGCGMEPGGHEAQIA